LRICATDALKDSSGVERKSGEEYLIRELGPYLP